MVVNGMVSLTHDKIAKVPDKGYSFCNCKNVWYTDWKNIEQIDYFREEYSDIHHQPRHKTQIENLFKTYLPFLKRHGNGGKKLLDMGCITDYLIDIAKIEGYECTGTDLEKHNNNNGRFIVGDLDKIVIEEKFDVIFANHVFEHFHYPIKAIKKCYGMLEEDGLIFVSMPDPFQVNWEKPDRWLGWSLHQHYIMWDMDSFCDEMEQNGFVTLLKKRNLDIRYMQDYHILFKK